MEKNLKSGAISGLASALALQPFDVMKTHQIVAQKSKSGIYTGFKYVLDNYGVKGLWRGSSAAASRAMVGAGLYFSTLEELKKLLGVSSFKAHSLAAGSTRFIVTSLCLPFSVVKTRMEAPECREYPSFRQAILSIVKTEGIKGFFKGLIPTLVRDVPYSAMGYGLYEEYIKLWKALTGLERDNKVVTILAGACAGTSATVITHPCDILKTRFQFAQVSTIKQNQYTGMFQAFKSIYLEEGVLGFFRGMGPRLSKRVLSFPLAWTIYEQLKLIP